MAAPDFINRDPAQISSEVKATFEASIGKEILPSQPEQLWINAAAYREILTRIGIQRAGEQCLVNYASGDRLDELGAFFGVTRLVGSKAQSTVKFTRVASTPALLIPAGTRLSGSSGDPGLWFETTADVTIPDGDTTLDVVVDAITSGVSSNDLTLNTVVDIVPGSDLAAQSLAPSKGGSDNEEDDPYRVRIKLAPSSFSSCGTAPSYRFFALSVDPTIIDVAVTSPSPIRVNVYPLVESGLPSEELKDRVRTAVTAEDVKNLTDDVRVESPVTVDYTIEAEVTLSENADTVLLSSTLQGVAQAYADEKQKKLGQDIVRSQIIAALQLPGVYSVNLLQPIADIVINPENLPTPTAVNVTVVGASPA